MYVHINFLYWKSVFQYYVYVCGEESVNAWILSPIAAAKFSAWPKQVCHFLMLRKYMIDAYREKRV